MVSPLVTDLREEGSWEVQASQLPTQDVIARSGSDEAIWSSNTVIARSASDEAIWSFSPVIPAEAGIQKVGEVTQKRDFLPKPSVRRPFCIGVKVMQTRKLYCAD